MASTAFPASRSSPNTPRRSTSPADPKAEFALLAIRDTNSTWSRALPGDRQLAGGKRPLALQLRFDRTRVAGGGRQAVAPAVGGVDVQVEGALGRAAAGEQAAGRQPAGVDPCVGGAHRADLGQVVVVTEPPGQLVTELGHRADEAAQLAAAAAPRPRGLRPRRRNGARLGCRFPTCAGPCGAGPVLAAGAQHQRQAQQDADYRRRAEPHRRSVEIRWMPSLRKLATLAAVLALALTAPSAQASGNGGVLVVGDSLEELTSPYLKQY